MDLGTQVREYKRMDVSEAVKAMTIDMLAEGLRHLPDHAGRAEFVFFGSNSNQTQVKCVVSVEGTVPFSHIVDGTDDKAMAKAYFLTLLNAYPYGTPSDFHGV